MADDVDPNHSLTTEPEAAAEVLGEEVVIEEAFMEDATAYVEAEAAVESAEPVATVEPLPTMADLDQVASELDCIDARLASLDEQRS